MIDCVRLGEQLRSMGNREEGQVSVLQTRLDDAVARAMVSRGAEWVRPRKGNGRIRSWRLLVAGTADIYVCVWPVTNGFRVSTTNPDMPFAVKEPDVDLAVDMAERIAQGTEVSHVLGTPDRMETTG